MATVHPRNRTALLVIDMQVGIVASTWEREKIVANVAHVVSRARDAGVPVIWVQHNDSELPRGSDPWQLVQELRPVEGELVIDKSFNSAFEQTELEPQLESLGVRQLLLAGALTNWCIRSTAYAALDRGYDLTLVKDAHTTDDLALSEGRVISARDIVDELNVAIRWLAYPGRTNTTATAADVRFSVSEDTESR
jgi:nicotinamidase-related amidase